MENAYSLADIKAATDGDDMMGNGAWWIIILFLFLFGANGFGGNRGNGGCATTEDVQNQFNFAALERQNNETVAAIRQAQYDTTGVIKDSMYTSLNEIKGVESLIAGLSANQNQCCCETNRNIDAVRYENAKNTCDIITAQTAMGQKILDAISANEIQQLRDKVSDLQLQNSQCAQNAYLVNALRPAPVPAVPYGSYYGFGYNGGCCNNSGCGGY